MSQRTRQISTNVQVYACPVWSGQNSLFGATAQQHSWPVPAGQLCKHWCFYLLQKPQSAFSEHFPNVFKVFKLLLLRGNAFSHLCSLPFTFHLTTPSESLRAIICLVVEFSCSRETRRYTWAFSSMTHLKASFHAQHNSWSQDPFCMCCKRVQSCLVVGGCKGAGNYSPQVQVSSYPDRLLQKSFSVIFCSCI